MSNHHSNDLPVGFDAGGYIIDSVLAHGGFSTTYIATREDDGSKVVLKECFPEHCATRKPHSIVVEAKPGSPESGIRSLTDARKNFIAEANLISSLRHPAVVPILEAFTMANTHTVYYVMPYIGANDLESYVSAGIKANKAQIAYLLAALLDGLNYIHQEKKLHRDVKPANIIISPIGQPVFIDFGSSREIEKPVMTCMLTKDFAPVEQMRHEKEGPWTDIYSLAASMIIMITGENLPSGIDRTGKSNPFVPLVERPDLLEQYGDVLLSSLDKAFAVEPEDRYLNTSDWIADLRQLDEFQLLNPVPLVYNQVVDSAGDQILLSEGTIQKRSMIPLNRPRKFPLKTLALIMLVLLLISGLATAAYLWIQQEEPLTPTEELVIDDTVEEPTELPQAVVYDYRLLTRPGAVLYEDANGSQVVKDSKVLIYSGYYPITENENFYQVALNANGDPIGWLKKDFAYEWKNNLVLRFTPIGTGANKRNRLVFFNESASAISFIKTLGEFSEKYRRFLQGDDVDEDTKRSMSSAGIMALEYKYGGDKRQFYLMPILDTLTNPDDHSLIRVSDGAQGLDYNVVKLAALKAPNPESKIEPKAPLEVQPQELVIDITFVIDASKSMGPFIESTKENLIAMIQSMEEPSDSKVKVRYRFGLCAYRDWCTSRDNVQSTDYFVGNQTDEAGGYVMKNFTNQKFVTANQMIDILKNDSVETGLVASEYDSLDYHEDVHAGLYEAIYHMPWCDEDDVKNARFIFLIGDAPGREPEVQESKLLGNANKPNRAIGNWYNVNQTSLVWAMSDRNIRLCSFFFGLDYQNLSKGEQLAFKSKSGNWDEYQAKGKTFFKDLSTVKGRSYDAYTSTIALKEGELVDVAKNRFFAEWISAITDKCKGLYSNAALEETAAQARSAARNPASRDVVAGSGIDAESQRLAKLSREMIDDLFSAAYVEWLSNTESPDEQLTSIDNTQSAGDTAAVQLSDATFWVAAENNASDAAIRPGILMTRADLEKLYNSLAECLAVFDGSSQNDTTQEAGVNNLLTLIGTTSLTGEVKDAEQASNNQTIKQMLELTAQLPYRSELLNGVNPDTPSAMEMVMLRLSTVVPYLEKILTNQNDEDWFDRGNNDASDDLICIPLDYLP